jgi:hypothetical protein
MVRCLKGKVDESGYMIFGAGNEIHIITPHDKNATAFTQSSAPRMMFTNHASITPPIRRCQKG